ncbi:ribosomal RNA-processing protein 7 homolog A isoform X2 [Ananas comosus]|uniref:Ribosomal RNA-processing protein 7 homolog A isoform X2 n=1 Tax=Ananas comosus TaxID=4615 RepID=A0A6P5F8K3_ANACO|nr:ribosomal RNA-processing protein 7 homolog A isoform X2 [Ananas comosus]
MGKDKNDRAVGKSRKKVLSKFKKRKVKEKSYVDAADADRIPTGNETKAILTDDNVNNNAGDLSQLELSNKVCGSNEPVEANIGVKRKIKKLKKVGKRKKDQHVSKENKFVKSLGDVDSEKVDQISAVDEDCSRGMKKWLIEYKQNRPGLKELQQRIDDFITTYEEQQEQERREKEARAAEGGWTVVVHHKGRKKTTDAESGVTVGSVAQAAVVDKIEKKKSKEVALDFYRFQKREAQRNEVMMLRSKFEQDKKRIQQLRAARKFRPY